MAITRVQHTQGVGTTSKSDTWGSTTTAGNLLVAVFSSDNTGGVGTHTANGSWLKADELSTASGGRLSIWYLANAAAQSSTGTFTSSVTGNFVSLQVEEVSGLGNGGALDVTAHNSGSTTGTTSGTTGGTAQANEYIAAGVHAIDTINGPDTFSGPLSSFVIVQQQSDNAVSSVGSACQLARIVSSTGTFSTGVTIVGAAGTSAKWVSVIATFKDGASTVNKTDTDSATLADTTLNLQNQSTDSATLADATYVLQNQGADSATLADATYVLQNQSSDSATLADATTLETNTLTSSESAFSFAEVSYPIDPIQTDSAILADATDFITTILTSTDSATETDTEIIGPGTQLVDAFIFSEVNATSSTGTDTDAFSFAEAAFPVDPIQKDSATITETQIVGNIATESISFSDTTWLITADLTDTEAAFIFTEVRWSTPAGVSDTESITLTDGSEILTVVNRDNELFVIAEVVNHIVVITTESAMLGEVHAEDVVNLGTDAFTMADVQKVQLNLIDAAAFADSQVVGQSSVDSVSMAEMSNVNTNTITSTDGATLADALYVLQGRLLDAFTLAEAQVVNVPFLRVLQTELAVMDDGTARVIQHSTDAVTLADVTWTNHPIALDAFFFDENYRLRLPSTDAATLAEAQKVLQASADSAGFTEAWVVGPAEKDAFLFHEVFTFQNKQTDSATLTEIGLPKPHPNDSGTMAESPVIRPTDRDLAVFHYDRGTTVTILAADGATLAELTGTPKQSTDAATMGEAQIVRVLDTDAFALGEMWSSGGATSIIDIFGDAVQAIIIGDADQPDIFGDDLPPIIFGDIN